MHSRRIGDVHGSAIGLGGMAASEGPPDEDRSVRTIHAALDAGVTDIDTADAYRLPDEEVGHDESLADSSHRTSGSGALRDPLDDRTKPPVVDPIACSSRPETIQASASAATIELSVDGTARLGRA